MESESSLVLPTIIAGGVFIVVLLRSVFGDRSSPRQRAETSGASVEDLIKAGRKIEAIKVYRAENPEVSLKQAKDAVEEMERTL